MADRSVSMRFTANTSAASRNVKGLAADTVNLGRRLQSTTQAADRMRSRLEQATRKLPKITIDADSTAAEIKFAELRQDLEALSSKRIGVDIDAVDASMKLAEIFSDLQELDRANTDVFVAADIGDCMAALAAVDTELSRLNRKSTTVEVDVDTDRAVSALGNLGDSFGFLGKVGPANLALAAGAIAALPVAATAAGGLVTLGLGGALAGLGLAASKGSEDVKAAIADMRANVSGQAKYMAEPFEAVWLTLTKEAQETFARWAPFLRLELSKLAPVLQDFVRHGASSLDELRPAITGIREAFSGVLRELGPRMPEFFRGISAGIDAIADAIAESPEDFAAMIVSLGKIVEVTGEAIGALIQFSGWIQRNSDELAAFADAVPGLNLVSDALNGMSDSNATAAQSLVGASQAAAQAAISAATAGDSVSALGDSMNDGKVAADSLRLALDQLAGAAFGLESANLAYESALDAATASLKENGQTLAIGTAAGRANRQALMDIATAAHDVTTAMVESGTPIDQVTAKVGAQRKAFIDQAVQMGLSRSAAKKLADEYGLIPAAVKTKIEGDNRDAMAKISATDRKLGSLNGKVATVRIRTIEEQIRNKIEKIGAADGGILTSVPAARKAHFFASGTEKHVAQIAPGGAMRVWAEPETQGEAYIPLAASKRERSMEILTDVATRFGAAVVPLPKNLLSRTNGNQKAYNQRSGTLEVEMVGAGALSAVMEYSTQAFSDSLSSNSRALVETMGRAGSLTSPVAALGVAARDLGQPVSVLGSETRQLGVVATGLGKSLDDTTGDLATEIKNLGSAIDRLASAVRSTASATSSTSKASGSKANSDVPNSYEPGWGNDGSQNGYVGREYGNPGPAPKKASTLIKGSGPTGPEPGVLTIDLDKQAASNVLVVPMANGGLVTSPTILAGEAGREMVVPLSPNKRARGISTLSAAAGVMGLTVAPRYSSTPSAPRYVQGRSSGSPQGMGDLLAKAEQIISTLSKLDRRSPVTVQNMQVREQADIDVIAAKLGFMLNARG